MPVAKPIILEALGLITAPNKLAQYADGACLVSLGVLHIAAGSHESAPKYVDKFTLTAGSGNFERVEIIPLPNGYLIVLAKRSTETEWVYRWIDADGTIHAWAKASHAYEPVGAVFAIDGRVSYVLTRDRVFVTTTKGPMVFDYLAPTSDAERAPRLAGMFAPAISVTTNTDDGGALHAGQQVHHVAVVTRHFPDCYEVTGPPSAAVQTFATGDKEADDEADRRNFTHTVFQRPGHPQLLPGDMVEMYRTYQTARPVNDGAPEDYDQGTSTTADYYLSSVFTIPAGGGSSWQWDEATGDLSLGEALYTNQGVVGASAQKRPPPIARVIEEFRGYTFYFDITEPPARVARAAGGMGQLTDAWSQTWGIGTRPGPTYDTVEINGNSFTLADADDLARTLECNVDDLARVNPDTPGELTQPATGFAFRFDYAGFGDFTIRASNGGNYNPPLPTLAEDAELIMRPRRRNGMMWTENGQPEAVVAAGIVGKGQVYAACATSQAMIIWTEYGLYRLSGTGGSSSAGFDWALDQIDTQVLLRGPRAFCRLGDMVFCASNNGCIVVDSGGMVREISTAALGEIGRNPLDVNNKRPFRENDNTRVTPDEGTGDVYFSFDGDPYPYVYSTRWNKWSRLRAADSVINSSAGNLQIAPLFAEIVDDEIVIREKSQTTYQAGIVRFQPTFDGDPSSLKRWSEVEWYFHGSAVGAPVKFICNEMEGMERDLDVPEGGNIPSFIQPVADASVQSTGVEFSLAQTWMEVDDDAPAVSNSLSLGYVTPESNVKYTFYGCCIRNNHSMTTTHRERGT